MLYEVITISPGSARGNSEAVFHPAETAPLAGGEISVILKFFHPIKKIKQHFKNVDFLSLPC